MNKFTQIKWSTNYYYNSTNNRAIENIIPNVEDVENILIFQIFSCIYSQKTYTENLIGNIEGF